MRAVVSAVLGAATVFGGGAIALSGRVNFSYPEVGEAVRWAALAAPWTLALAAVWAAVRFAAERGRARRLEAVERARASTDAVTGLPNGRAFAAAAARGLASGRRFAAAILEFDGASEAQAAILARRLSSARSARERVYALGAGRFGLLALLDGRSGALRARLLAYEAAAAQPISGAGGAARLAGRAALAFAPRHGASVDGLIARLERRLEGLAPARPMALGLYTEAEDRRRIAEAAFDAEARRAFEAGACAVRFAPEAVLKTGAVESWAVDLEWTSPSDLAWALAEKAGRDPADLRAALTRSGVGAALTERLLAAAAAAQQALGGAARFAVAVDDSDWRGAGFVERLAEIAAETRLDLARLELVLLGGEWHLAAGPEGQAQADTLAALRRAGVRLTLDGFGLGRVRPADLARAPVDRVRLPADWVREVEDDWDARALVDGTLRLAESLRLETCAAGVETEGQAAYLQRRHCRAVSGPLIGGALPAPVETLALTLEDGDTAAA